MTAKILFVAVHLPADGTDEYSSYQLLSATEKLKILFNKIVANHADLSKKHPDTMIVYCWREYGVVSETQNQVSDQFKKEFKTLFSNLTKQYSNMLVIAGTIPYAKKADDKKIETVTSYYKELDWVRTKLEGNYDNLSELKSHYLEFLKEKSFKDPKKDIYALRNVCYIFQDGKCTARAKVAPFNETSYFDIQKATVFFQPCKNSKSDPVYTFKHPYSNEDVSFCIEICREHERGLAVFKQVKADFHIVISASVNREDEHIIREASHFIHVDSSGSPTHLAFEKSDPDVSLCVIDGYSTVHTEPNPVKPQISSRVESSDSDEDTFSTSSESTDSESDDEYKRAMKNKSQII